MTELEQLRAKTGELLDEGLNTGTLTVSEHSWRQTHLAQATSVDAMESLVQDLLEPERLPARTEQVSLLSNRVFHAADLGSRAELVTVMGQTTLKLRGVSSRRLELVTIMGETIVEVPEGVLVKLNCTPILGDVTVPEGLTSQDGTIEISGAVILGTLRLVRVQYPANR